LGDWDGRNDFQAGEPRNWISSVYHAVWRKNLMRSGIVTVLLIGCVLLGLTVAFRAHMQGNFHKLKLKANLETERQDVSVARPGGQDPIVLLRSRMPGDNDPEFLSATLLPGRGMNVLQITAFIPGRGEVKLLASPSVDEAAAATAGSGADADGWPVLAMGGAFEAPWAGDLGAPTEGNGETKRLFPAEAGTAGDAAEPKGGLLLGASSDSIDSETLPDGGTAHVVFHMGDFGGRWASKTDVSVSALLGSRAIELTVIATNVGDKAEPMGIGWTPRFAIAAADRQQIRLHLPTESRVEIRDKGKRQPSGRVIPVAGTAYDFTASGGSSLGAKALDDCFTGLQQRMLDDGPKAELINPAGGYGLRLSAMSPTIRAMRVIAPAKGDFISIDAQYNLPDPFGKEWSDDTNTGMVMLEPGQSTEWKVRLELYALGAAK
jgi:aldose 1-epimerase